MADIGSASGAARNVPTVFMLPPQTSDVLEKRDGTSAGSLAIILVLVIIVLVIVIVFSFYYFNRRANRLRKERGYNKRQSWRESISTLSSGFRRAPPVRDDVRNSHYSPAVQQAREVEEGHGVDRNTSVRSVITLPAYSYTPRESDIVIGREGDRAGMDTVVEFPETAEDEENRREAEMESLYQIRQRRRQEAAERSERRRRRRQARQRGDFGTVAALRQESQRATEQQMTAGSAALISEHETRSRGRKVSAVQYGALGVAKHDGSRVRANSNDSDNRPLLDTAGDLGMSGPVRPWMSREDLSTHSRGGSSATNLSVWTYDSDDHSAASDGESDFDVVDFQQTHSRSSSMPRSSSRPRRPSGARSRATSLAQTLTIQTDVGNSPIPHPDPPRYESVELEEAPPYQSPIRTVGPPIRVSSPPAPRLPVIERLPSIRITEGTPIDPRPDDFPDFNRHQFE